MKKICSLFFLISFISVCSAESYRWNLPIKLNATRTSVHNTIGPPNEILNSETFQKNDPELAKNIGELHNEYFYSSGLVVRMHNNKVFGITVNTHGSYHGWITYQGAIVNGVKLSDTYESVVKKLGPPTKIEESEIMESKKDLNKPVVFPAEKSCYWRADNYTVQINFLMQAQSISENVTGIRGSISTILVYK